MNKKSLFLLAIVALMAIFLAACSSTDSTVDFGDTPAANPAGVSNAGDAEVAEDGVSATYGESFPVGNTLYLEVITSPAIAEGEGAVRFCARALTVAAVASGDDPVLTASGVKFVEVASGENAIATVCVFEMLEGVGGGESDFAPIEPLQLDDLAAPLSDGFFSYAEGNAVELGTSDTACGYSPFSTYIRSQDTEPGNQAVIASHTEGDDAVYSFWRIADLMRSIGVDPDDASSLATVKISGEATHFLLAQDVTFVGGVATLEGALEEWNSGVTIVIDLRILLEEYGGYAWIGMRNGEFRIVGNEYIQGHQALRVRHLDCRGKTDPDGSPRDVILVLPNIDFDFFTAAPFEYQIIETQ